MKTVREVMESDRPGWRADEYGIAMQIAGDEIEVRIESLLFGACFLAVYRGGQLVGEKMPITLGTPAHNRKRSTNALD